MYIWDNGKLSRIEGDGHEESRQFRTDEVCCEMPTSISCKLEDTLGMSGGRVDQIKERESN